MVLLGWFRGCRCVLVDLPPVACGPRAGERFAELRGLVAELAADEGESLPARVLESLAHRPSPLRPLRRAHPGRHAPANARRCGTCGTLVFPRLDPAVIVLVHDGEQLLLGRQSGWPTGRFSAMAVSSRVKRSRCGAP